MEGLSGEINISFLERKENDSFGSHIGSLCLEDAVGLDFFCAGSLRVSAKLILS